MRKLIIIIVLLMSGICYADDIDTLNTFDDVNRVILNEQLRRIDSRLKAEESETIDINTNTSGILTLDRGGTGKDLSSNSEGDIIYFNSSNEATLLSASTSGHFLMTQGANNPPEWHAQASFNWDWVSTTSVTGTNSGDIAISKDKQYLVLYKLVDANIPYLRFNSDSNSYYKYSVYKNTIGAAESHTGSTSASEILLGDGGSEDFLTGRLWINTKAVAGDGSDDGFEAVVTGTSYYRLGTSNDISYARVNAVYLDDGAEVTSFEIVVGSSSTMNIEVYEITP